jgi:hypothetical protein
MPFTKVEPKVPTAIGDISVPLGDFIATEDKEAYQEARFEVQVLDADGDVMHPLVQGDLLLHLDNADKLWLSDFMDRMRAKAIQEIIP